MAVRTPHIAIAAPMGIAVPSENIDKKADTTAAMEFWINPWRDDAAPALSGNGCRHAATDCGHKDANPIININLYTQTITVVRSVCVITRPIVVISI